MQHSCTAESSLYSIPNAAQLYIIIENLIYTRFQMQHGQLYSRIENRCLESSTDSMMKGGPCCQGRIDSDTCGLLVTLDSDWKKQMCSHARPSAKSLRSKNLQIQMFFFGAISRYATSVGIIIIETQSLPRQNGLIPLVLSATRNLFFSLKEYETSRF